MDKLERYFLGRIQTTFGIGTNLTNDLGVALLSIVVKVVAANGVPVVEPSDNIDNASGDPNEIDRIEAPHRLCRNFLRSVPLLNFRAHAGDCSGDFQE